MDKAPKYVLKIKRLSKTKTVIIFRRNYLNINNFKYKDNRWEFEEKFTHYGTMCKLKLIIHSDNICDMYDVDCKEMKIKGPRNGFGLFIRLPQQKIPISQHGQYGCVEYYLACEGKTLAYDAGRGIGKTRKKQIDGVVSIHDGSRTPTEVPNSISWSASHPFQGGGISPR